MPEETRPDLQPFASIELWVRPDHDEVFDGVPEGSVVMKGNRCYVRESLWPMLKAELEQMPRRH